LELLPQAKQKELVLLVAKVAQDKTFWVAPTTKLNNQRKRVKNVKKIQQVQK
jgi:hypothetical protein